jgi:hypothetical protein
VLGMFIRILRWIIDLLVHLYTAKSYSMALFFFLFFRKASRQSIRSCFTSQSCTESFKGEVRILEPNHLVENVPCVVEAGKIFKNLNYLGENPRPRTSSEFFVNNLEFRFCDNVLSLQDLLVFLGVYGELCKLASIERIYNHHFPCSQKALASFQNTISDSLASNLRRPTCDNVG